MNWRLLTDEEKRRNKLGRQQRKDRQKAARRRRLALAAIADPSLFRMENVVTQDAIAEMLWAQDFRAAKRAIRRLNARVLASDPETPTFSLPGGPALRVIPRPTRVLRDRNRGVAPRLYQYHVPPMRDFLGVDKAITQARDMLNHRSGIETVLHFLAHPQATGLNFAGCAALLHCSKTITAPIQPGVVRTLEKESTFNARLADARAVFNAMLLSKEIEPAAGDWCFLTAAQLDELLPGLWLPEILRRDEYLVNIIPDGTTGLPACLDLHGIGFSCLIRHPLE